MSDEKKSCPECGAPIIGRVDKIFCSDACRNLYHNRLNADSNNYIRRVNRKLKKNRSILAELNPNGKTKVHLKQLARRDFDFEHFTSIYTTKKGTVYYFCYEYGYLPLENDFYALVKRDVD